MKKRFVPAILFCTLIPAFANAQGFILEDAKKLDALKTTLHRAMRLPGDTVLTQLMDNAQAAMKDSLYSVTFLKRRTAPSGNPHDYMSQAPYWWPDSTKKDGKPYIRRDGRINPERNDSKDYGQMGAMSRSVQALAKAFFISGDEKYAQRATKLLRTWFVDTATRMNPHLDYGQFIPGITAGRGIGIIETVGLTNIPDAITMLRKSKSWNAYVDTGVWHWFHQYRNWLQNSTNGKDEASQLNNHGTYYDLQVAVFSIYIGDTATAHDLLRTQTIKRIDQQFTIEGAQPLELIRTKSWGYSTMNLSGWCRLAKVGEIVGVDLWHYKTMDGKGIEKVFEWFAPYVLKQKRWPYEQIEPFTYETINELFRQAAKEYPGTLVARTAMALTAGPTGKDH
jgi:hypothetical protein